MAESRVPGKIVLAVKGVERFELGALEDDHFLWDLLRLQWQWNIHLEVSIIPLEKGGCRAEPQDC